ncbi:alpha/beta hydrolase [Sphingobium sp.]|uniref:alpha/beta fold hydrolase n=1 Tax=Sphingobium sp. TaxID=1912891 RepID=UPI002C52BDFF|nr:alpha/beta hydrolase [Sphingobium sp.]HUD92704.1 alpha/beta hydrolase [Sphingobium sp.]
MKMRFEGEGLMLAADVAGDADAPPILFMHGGGQTRHSWGRAAALAAQRGFRSVSIDLRGHGESDWAANGCYDLDDYVADARKVIAQIGGRAAIVGASLGGLTGLVVAGESQELASALVLVDVAPRIEIEGADEIRGFMTSAPNGFASVDEAADAVSAYLPHRERPSNIDGLMKNLRLGEDGRYRWHWDPAMTKSGNGPPTGRAQFLLERAAGNLSVPTLLVRGGISKVVSQQSVDEFLALAPHAEYVNVAGADHMVAGDRNDAFNDAVFNFLERQD